jgi:predicted transcriptional regulator
MNKRERTGTEGKRLPQRTTARGGGSKAYHFRIDDETYRQLLEAVAWYEGNDMSYSESCIVRAAIREYLEQLQGTSMGQSPGSRQAATGNLTETVKRIDLARRGGA